MPLARHNIDRRFSRRFRAYPRLPAFLPAVMPDPVSRTLRITRNAGGRKAVKVPRRFLAVGLTLTVGGMVAVGVTSATAVAAPVTPASPDPARAFAAQKAANLVASRPAYLNASPNDKFTQGAVISSGSTQYVPYERTYGGVPVVGGDFVLVLNNAGQLVFNSVALQRPIGNLSTAPTLAKGDAEAVA